MFVIIIAIIMNKKLILALLIGLGLFAACNDNTAQNHNKWGSKTEVTINESDLISLNQFPTIDKRLYVEISPDFMVASIYRDGKLFQTVLDEEYGLVSAGDVAPVHFLDANFDGYTDIFIGEGESRTYSTLLLWNEKEKQFVRIGELGEPDWQGFKLCPNQKMVISGGSGSYCSFYITRSHFEGFELLQDEQLTIITDKLEYIAYGVHRKYTLQDANQKVLYSTEKSDGLPSLWQTIVKAYDYE